jgi:hypothetical protein
MHPMLCVIPGPATPQALIATIIIIVTVHVIARLTAAATASVTATTRLSLSAGPRKR